MPYSVYCPYKELTGKPCYSCGHYIIDTDECRFNNIVRRDGNNNNASLVSYAPTYEERLRDYERKRQEYLQLSKEALVDLIVQRPSMF